MHNQQGIPAAVKYLPLSSTLFAACSASLLMIVYHMNPLHDPWNFAEDAAKAASTVVSFLQ